MSVSTVLEEIIKSDVRCSTVRSVSIEGYVLNEIGHDFQTAFVEHK